MAKVILIIQDAANGRSVDITTEFEPELRRGQKLTGAQHMAMTLMDGLSERAGAGSISDAMEFESEDRDDA